MLKKTLRIQKKEDFDRVFRAGKPFACSFFSYRYLSPAQGSFRLGFSLSPKHLPRAVDRNRLRRIIAAVVAEQRESWPKDADLVFYTRGKPPQGMKLSKEGLAPALLNALSPVFSRKN